MGFARALPELQALLSSTRHYAIWDDHDFGPNDSNRSFVFKGESLKLFQRYWANPSPGLPELAGNFSSFSFLDADFFLLDDRTWRSADRTATPKDEVNLFKEIKDYIFGYNAATRLVGKQFSED